MEELEKHCPNCGSDEWYDLGSDLYQCLVCGNIVTKDGEEA